jgi:hypothetical protein
MFKERFSLLCNSTFLWKLLSDTQRVFCERVLKCLLKTVIRNSEVARTSRRDQNHFMVYREDADFLVTCKIFLLSKYNAPIFIGGERRSFSKQLVLYQPLRRYYRRSLDCTYYVTFPFTFILQLHLLHLGIRSAVLKSRIFHAWHLQFIIKGI